MMKPATRVFIMAFLALCAIGVGITFIPVAHTPVTAASEPATESTSH